MVVYALHLRIMWWSTHHIAPSLDGSTGDNRFVAAFPIVGDSGFIVELGCWFPRVVFVGVVLPSN